MMNLDRPVDDDLWADARMKMYYLTMHIAMLFNSSVLCLLNLNWYVWPVEKMLMKSNLSFFWGGLGFSDGS